MLDRARLAGLGFASRADVTRVKIASGGLRWLFHDCNQSGMLRGMQTSPGDTMSDDAALITDTLERVAERVGDPMPLIFERLFAELPEAEALFIRDKGGLVRGQMFQVTMESLLDFLGDRSYGANLIQIERVNHQGLGVDPEMFDRFYLTVMATFKSVLGSDWTAEMETVWSRVINDLTGLSGQNALQSDPTG
jgi:hemoglobin-like flavoprotein